MRRLFILISIVMQAMQMTAAATFPEVSTEGNEHWYYIQMQRGMTVLTSMGEGKNMQTAEAVAAKKRSTAVEGGGRRQQALPTDDTRRTGDVLQPVGRKVPDGSCSH